MFALPYTARSGLGCKGGRGTRDLDPMGSWGPDEAEGAWIVAMETDAIEWALCILSHAEITVE